MTFRQMSAALMLGLLAVSTAVYVAVVVSRLSDVPADEFDYQMLLLGAVFWTVVAGAVGHLVLSARADDGDRIDERDRAIANRGERVAGVVIVISALTALALAMADAASFWIAHAILAGFVVAEMAKSSVMLASYRRGW